MPKRRLTRLRSGKLDSNRGLDSKRASEAYVRERRLLDQRRKRRASARTSGDEPEAAEAEQQDGGAAHRHDGSSPRSQENPAEPSREDCPTDEPQDLPPRIVAAAAFSLLAGVWLMVAPLAIGYHDGDPVWNDVVCGCFVAIYGLMRLTGAYHQPWTSALLALVGAWIAVAAMWLDQSSGAKGNDVVLGVIVFMLGLIGASGGRDEVELETDA
jgi:hypothetical protein